MSDDEQRVDDEVLALIAAGAHERAAVRVLETHGPGIYRMFTGVFHDEAIAQDLYQRFSVELWKSIPSFAGRSAVYTWAYVIARRTLTWRFRQAEPRREERLDTHEHGLLAQHLSRTATPAWRRTETKHRFQELCADLPRDERLLVMLRIGQRMGWKQIALVIDDAGALAADEEALAREAARLRKRFERVKEKLRAALV